MMDRRRFVGAAVLGAAALATDARGDREVGSAVGNEGRPRSNTPPSADRLGGRRMGAQIDFPYPFTGFNSLTFTNCYASVYMYLEGIVGIDDYECAKREGKPCDGCGNCSNSTAKKQEAYYFVLDTLSGRSSVRPTFADTPDDTDNAPETIDLLMGITGYGYRVVQEGAIEEARASIDRGTPVLARMKDPANGAFRVLTGYEGDALIAPDPANAQGQPTQPTCADVAQVIIVTGKVQPRFSLLDGLERIRTVMLRNRGARVWEQCQEQFDYWDGGVQALSFEDIQRRFQRICQMAWYNFNCHNFAETFRQRVWEPLKGPCLDEVCQKIHCCYHNSHTVNWQLIGLYECRDWSSRRYHELEWGYCECVVQCLERLRAYDAEVLAAVEQAIAIVGGDGRPRSGQRRRKVA